MRTHDSVERLRHHLAEGRPYRYFVTTRSGSSREWIPAHSDSTGKLWSPTEELIELAQVSAWVVAYENDQVVDGHFGGLRPPAGVVFLDDTGAIDPNPFEPGAILAGMEKVPVAFSTSPARPHNRDYFRTTLRNDLDVPIRIVGFSPAAVKRTWRGRLKRVEPGRLYSAEEFKSWYGVPGDGWIAPGVSVSDPNNWGRRGTFWVYYVQTRVGESLVTGARRD